MYEIKTTTNAISNQNEQKKGVYVGNNDEGGGDSGKRGMYIVNVFKCKAHSNQTTKSVSTVAEIVFY